MSETEFWKKETEFYKDREHQKDEVLAEVKT